MFDETRAVANKIISDFKKSSFVISLITQIFFIVYDIYELVVGRGYLAVNVVLLSLSTVYFIFYIVVFVDGGKAAKEVKRQVGTVYRLTKYVIHAATLGVAFYVIYTFREGATFIEILLTALNAVGFLVQISVEAARQIIARYVKLLQTAVASDTQTFRKLQNPQSAVVGAVNRPIGAIAEKFAAKMGTEQKADSNDKIKQKVDEIAAAYTEERAKKAAKRKLEKKEKKQEELREIKAELKENIRIIGQGIKYTIAGKGKKKEDISEEKTVTDSEKEEDTPQN